MRIIAGSLRGLRLQGPPEGGPTRPTTDMARESLFSAIGPRIVEARFLDLFGGTGAIALEAASRGASRVVTVECHPKALKVIHANLERAKRPPEVELRAQRVERYLADCAEEFDLVFADPPFKVPPQEVLALVAASRAVAPEAPFYLEYLRTQSPRNPDPPEPPPGYALGRTYRFGEKEITCYLRDPAP